MSRSTCRGWTVYILDTVLRCPVIVYIPMRSSWPRLASTVVLATIYLKDVAARIGPVTPWQIDDASRFNLRKGLVHPGFPPFGCGCCGSLTFRCVQNRTRQSFSATLGHRWRPSDSKSRLVYLDLGANAPDSSVVPFRHRYPDGHLFSVTAFEADTQWYDAYGNGTRHCQHHQTCGVTLIRAGVGVNNSVAFLSTEANSIRRSVSAYRDVMHTRAVRTVGFRAWLRNNVRHVDWVVCKMDIENSEFDVIPDLLAHPSTFRLIDELFLECHHRETWWKTSLHLYTECLDLYNRALAAGVWVHDYY